MKIQAAGCGDQQNDQNKGEKRQWKQEETDKEITQEIFKKRKR